MTPAFFAAATVALLVASLFATALLFFVNKLYKLPGNTFAQAGRIIFFSSIIPTLLAFLVLRFSSFRVELDVAGVLVAWVIGFFLYKKYFGIDLKKFLAIWLTYTAIVAFISFTLIFFARPYITTLF